MKTIAIGALWALLMTFAGWQFVDSRDARAETRTTIEQLRTAQTDTQQKVAVLEEVIKNQKEQMNRIELGVNSLLRKPSKPVF